MAAVPPNAVGAPPAVPTLPAVPALNADFVYAFNTMDPLDTKVEHILTICGCTSPVIVRALRIEGINTLEQFSVLQPSDIKDLAGCICSASRGHRGAPIGAVHIANLSAVLTW